MAKTETDRLLALGKGRNVAPIYPEHDSGSRPWMVESISQAEDERVLNELKMIIDRSVYLHRDGAIFSEPPIRDVEGPLFEIRVYPNTDGSFRAVLDGHDGLKLGAVQGRIATAHDNNPVTAATAALSEAQTYDWSTE